MLLTIDSGNTNVVFAVFDDVITSYSIHYTKLYDQLREPDAELVGGAAGVVGGAPARAQFSAVVEYREHDIA